MDLGFFFTFKQTYFDERIEQFGHQDSIHSKVTKDRTVHATRITFCTEVNKRMLVHVYMKLASVSSAQLSMLIYNMG